MLKLQLDFMLFIRHILVTKRLSKLKKITFYVLMINSRDYIFISYFFILWIILFIIGIVLIKHFLGQIAQFGDADVDVDDVVIDVMNA